MDLDLSGDLLQHGSKGRKNFIFDLTLQSHDPNGCKEISPIEVQGHGKSSHAFDVLLVV
jgi:hypothetical protein